MATYHVFIERPQDPSPTAIAKAAEGIAGRFGVPATVISQRLAAGRFRVKANVDLEKARRFASELEALGAVCSVIDASAPEPRHVPSTRLPTPDPMPLAMAQPAPQAAPLPPPVRSAEPAPLLPVSGVRSAVVETSGLAAASNHVDQDIGALGGDSGAGFRLSAIDGTGDELATGGLTFSEPPAAAAPPPPVPIAPRSPTPAALNPFLPPEMAAEQELQLTIDRPQQPAAPASPPHAVLEPTPPEPAVAVAHAGPNKLLQLLEYFSLNPRPRFVAGVVLAIVIGFIPVHFVSSMRENSGYARLQADLHTTYSRAVSPADFAGLAEVRKATLTLMSSKRFNITVGGCLLWIVIGGGIAFLWFRKIDWETLRPIPPARSLQ